MPSSMHLMPRTAALSKTGRQRLVWGLGIGGDITSTGGDILDGESH